MAWFPQQQGKLCEMGAATMLGNMGGGHYKTQTYISSLFGRKLVNFIPFGLMILSHVFWDSSEGERCVSLGEGWGAFTLMQQLSCTACDAQQLMTSFPVELSVFQNFFLAVWTLDQNLPEPLE